MRVSAGSVSRHEWRLLGGLTRRLPASRSPREQSPSQSVELRPALFAALRASPPNRWPGHRLFLRLPQIFLRRLLRFLGFGLGIGVWLEQTNHLRQTYRLVFLRSLARGRVRRAVHVRHVHSDALKIHSQLVTRMKGRDAIGQFPKRAACRFHVHVLREQL